MRANELRIGNLVQYRDGEIITVVGLGLTYITMQKSINGVAQDFEERISEAYNPIPLTEDWLKRFGFKKLENDWQIKGLIIHTRKRGYIVNKKIPVISSVHQLQNLYFALTGTELKLN